jgi:hydrogenase/urease accessory protein HupE
VKRTLSTALAAAVLLFAPPAHAHPLDESRAEVTVAGSTVHWRLAVHPSFLAQIDTNGDGRISSEEIQANLPALDRFFAARLFVNTGGRLCDPQVEGVSGGPGLERVTITIDYRCPGPIEKLRIEMHLFDGITPNWVCLARLHWGGEDRQFAFREGSAAWELGGPAAGERGLAALGVEHIFTGYDHLMFLVGILLLGGRFWSLVKIVTAFTIAHSVTLILAALGLVELPPTVVEPAIALSIAYVGAENFFLKSTDRRWIIAFVFGLVHGFGFAGVLREMGLPERGLVISLLSFNVGVEMGQLAVVAVVLPLILLMRRLPWHRRATYAISAVITGFGLYWFFQRI